MNKMSGNIERQIEVLEKELSNLKSARDEYQVYELIIGKRLQKTGEEVKC
jgi:hypothetical protein